MARRYQLPCEKCQTRILIETTQAGQSVSCPGCQEQIQIGTLREIRALEADSPTLAEQAVAAKSRSKMSPGSRLMFVMGTLLFFVAGIWGLLAMLNANRLAVEKPGTRIDERAIKAVNLAPPATMLELWEEVTDDALAEWREHPYHVSNRLSQENRTYSYIGFGLAGIGLLAMVGAFALKL